MWGWVNSEVRSSCLRRQFQPRLPGFLMSTAANTQNICEDKRQKLLNLQKLSHTGGMITKNGVYNKKQLL